MNALVVILALAVLVALVVAIPILGGSFGKKGKSVKHGSGVTLDKKFVQSKWAEIETTFSLGGASHLKSAILEADKLVDHVLKARGIAGQSMGERLKGAKKYFAHYADYDNLWFAHKVRNNIAHEAGHELNSGEAKRAIDYFKKALKHLGAL